MKRILMSALMAAVLLAGSCSDWNETEGLEFGRPTPEQQNPEKYQKYLESVRNFKLGEHKVMIMTVAGTSETPYRQNQHPMSMPDSVDFICMTNTDNLHPVVVNEIAEVYKTKGTRSLCVVDYMSIEAAWRLMFEDNGGKIADVDEEDIADFAAYCKAQTDLQLSNCDKYGFAGIVVSYLGRTATPLEARGQEEYLTSISNWRSTHSDKMMFFRGYARNIANEKWHQNWPGKEGEKPSLFYDCDYIMLLCGTATSNSLINTVITRQLIDTDDDNVYDNVPVDRLVLEVAIPSIDDPTQVGAKAAFAASWVMEPDERERFSKVGLAASNAQDDYFNIKLIYQNVREAIGILNTEPELEPEPEPEPEPSNN